MCSLAFFQVLSFFLLFLPLFFFCIFFFIAAVRGGNCAGVRHGLCGSEDCKFFLSSELWRNTALKKFGVELRAGVELGGTL